MLEDRYLLGLLRMGEKDGLRQIYAKYKNDLLTIAKSLLSDNYAAEDWSSRRKALLFRHTLYSPFLLSFD